MADRVEIPISKADDIAKTVDSFLQAFGKNVSEEMGAALDEVGKEAVKKLKATSPKRTGRYAKGWKYKRQANNKGRFEAKVYNATDGNLTHILEFGHPKMSGDRVIGEVKGQPHIAPVNEWVQSDFPKRFAQKLQQKK